MNVGRRHETFGSETKDNLLLTAIAVARVTSFPFLIFIFIWLHLVPATALRIFNPHCRTWEPQLRHVASF